MKLKQLILILAVAIGASNLTIIVIHAIEQWRQAQAHEQFHTNAGADQRDD